MGPTPPRSCTVSSSSLQTCLAGDRGPAAAAVAAAGRGLSCCWTRRVLPKERVHLGERGVLSRHPRLQGLEGGRHPQHRCHGFLGGELHAQCSPAAAPGTSLLTHGLCRATMGTARQCGMSGRSVRKPSDCVRSPSSAWMPASPSAGLAFLFATSAR